MALDILNDNWGPYTHTEVENALKAYLSGLEDRINQAIQSGGVGLTDLSAEVQALLNKADTALQSETDPTVPNWAKQSNKPTYNVSEIIYSSNRPLSLKLDEMTAEILAAGATDSEMSDSSKKPVQNKVIKAYVDAAVLTLQNALNALMNGQSVTDAIDTFNEVKAFLNGIDTSDPTLANQLLTLNNAITALQTALAGKANSADVYNKTEVDTKVTNAGEVKSVTINGTNHTPNSSGVIDLGTIQGEKGDKGDAGDVNISDGQLNELTVVNDLEHNTQGDGAVLSAYMGYFLGQKMGKVVNANDGKIYRIWIGTQAELDALGSNIERDVIYLVGVVPTIEITAIGINAVEGDVNLVNLHADLYPPTTTQENVTWSIDNDIDFSIVSDGLDAVLRVLSTADDSTVNVTCRSVEKPSVSTVETLVKSYDPTVPITAITGITHSTASTNKEQFVAVVEPEGGNTPAIVWSVVATPQNAATIDTNGLLTIIDDCTVVVTATSGSNTFTTNEINLQWQQDPNAPIVWEDANMEAFMLSKVTHANPSYITYAEAATFNSAGFSAESTASSYPFANIKGVVTKFNEWQYFTSLTKVNLSGFSALTEITMPSTVILGSGNTRISGTALTSIVIPEGVTTYPFISISGSTITSISFPSTLTTTSAPNGNNTINCANLKVLDFSGTSITSVEWNRPNLGGVQIIKFPPSLTSIGTSSRAIQLARDSANLSWVEIGTANGGSSISGIYINNYSGHAYNIIIHSTTPPAFTWSDSAFTAIYVPDAAVDTYKAANGFSGYASRIKGLSELPSDWDTPSTNE